MISGLINFDRDRVAVMVKAVILGGVIFFDIVVDFNLVEMVWSLINLFICVFVIEVVKFVLVVKVGVDLIEIGNYEVFYV